MAVIQDGAGSSLAGVDSNTNLKVVTPTTGTQSGFTRWNYLPDASTSREAKISHEGENISAIGRIMFDAHFNNTTLLNTQFSAPTTTATVAQASGFVSLNAGGSVTITQGAALLSWRSFQIYKGQTTKLVANIRTQNAAQANKIMEFGFGTFNTGTAGMGAALNDGAVFRWSTTGGFQGVVSHAGSEQTVNLNGGGSGTPFSDAVSRKYELIVTAREVEFWVNDSRLGAIAIASDASMVFRTVGLPIMARYSNITAPSLAAQLQIGHITVINYGPEADLPINYRQALMGKGAYINQPGLTTTNGQTANWTNSTAPTSATLSNTAAGYTTLGGLWQFAAPAGAVTDFALFGYQNPIIPVATGAANDGRNLVITRIRISSCNTGAAVATTPTILQWGAAVGSSAVSLATTDSATARAPKRVALGMQSFLVGAAIGTIATDIDVDLTTPLVVEPGLFFHLICTVPVGTATASQVIRGTAFIEGYWD